jgi:hypothetical protein
MVSDYLKHARSLEELDALIEKDRVAAALIIKTQFIEKVIHCIAHIDKACEISLARIVSESEIAAARITANSEIATARLGARFKIILSEIEKLNLTGISQRELEVTMAMLSESSRQYAVDLAAEAKQGIQQLEEDTADAISRIKKHAEDSIAEIEAVKAEVLKQNNEAAAAAHQKLQASKSQDRTQEQVAREGVDAAGVVLSAAYASKVEVETKSAIAVELIQSSMTDAQQRVKSICDSAIGHIEAVMNDAIDKMELMTNDRLAPYR